MNVAHVLPDCTHIARSHAHDLAVAIVMAIKPTGRKLRVYLGPDGAMGYEWVLPSGAVEEVGMCAGTMAIVGTYDEESTVVQVTEDLMAMERERIG